MKFNVLNSTKNGLNNNNKKIPKTQLCGESEGKKTFKKKEKIGN